MAVARKRPKQVQPKHKPVFKQIQQTFAMGAPANFRWEEILAIAGAMEDEEIARKLSLRK